MLIESLSKYWADLAHGEFQRMLGYKAAWNGAVFIKAHRWFPSSKLCSNCLYYNPDLTLAVRVFKCPLCGLELDRDYNAALNLENYYYIYQPLLVTVAESSAETINAGGEAVSPTKRGRASMKQETQFHLPLTRKRMKGTDG
ncbi:MAG: zinc ribbon domain-containing protein [Candidatus Hodarchaeota archaeon]